ncbi:beta-N-acetylhexosaminidase [Hymenobacter sp. GOD-10R]|uniref:beta-N-acetylhexosaminidase n=1 Tax=Hymenobacter sp. GOD-10R TaxID=3093922 RepID=UPI002D768EDE|nr:family 20 glycosylhydrolase [Hymenobacter sp. GOD-10R]WRQ29842.1 family 20 glycosylhydrolase [Hymenobacter sp. GOD-10R]
MLVSLRAARLLLCSCFLLCSFIARAQPTDTRQLMPVPAQLTWGAGRFALKGKLGIRFETDTDPAVRAAANRFATRLNKKTGFAQPKPALTIRYGRVGGVKLGEDESYSLRVTPVGIALTSATSLGALRGLATLEQLLTQEKKSYYFPEVDITDQPRFAWRGLLIDAARHFMPVAVMKRNLDAMAAVKLNVLHWHLSDDQGFRVESKLLPKLQQVAASGQYYTQAQVHDVVRYAAARGIRVVPEFDLPGHTTALISAYPVLASNDSVYAPAQRWGVLNIAIDPTKESTYQLLDTLLTEMMSLFPDAYFHIGGDENNGQQWRRNPRIAEYMRANNMMKENGKFDTHALQTAFMRRMLPIVTKGGKIMVGWDEILAPDLPAEIVIQSWRGRKALYEAVKAGHPALLSNGYYIDLNYSAGSHYLNDPLLADNGLTPEQQQRVLGGETAMWAEFADSTILDSRIWPRAAAIAERFWSLSTVRDVPDMYRRLAIASRQLDGLGLQHRRVPEQLLLRLAGKQYVAPLGVLAGVIEPVKEYKRHRQGFTYTTQTPLNRLVDAALPEAEAARQFGVDISALLQSMATATNSKLPKDAQTLTTFNALRTTLSTWQKNDALLQPLLTTEPSLREYAPLSVQLATLAGLGLERLRLLEKGEKPTPAWQAAAVRQLEAAKAPAGQAELAIVESMRKLATL